MIRKLTYFLVLVLLALPLTNQVNGQNLDLKFDQLSTDQGLSSGTVECSFKDSKGYMWFGTRDGLNRYDGYNATIYKPHPKDTSAISGNIITSITEDADGRIWVSTLNNGISIFDWRTETFSHYKHDINNPSSIANNRVLKIFIDEENNVLIATIGGLDIYNWETDSFDHIEWNTNAPTSLNSNSVYSIIQDAPGFFWIGTHSGSIELFDLKNKTFERFTYNENIAVVNRRKPLFKDSKGYIWVGTAEEGAYRLDREKKSFTHFEFDPVVYGVNANIIVTFYEDENNNIWLGSDGEGIHVYHPTTNSFTRIIRNNFRKESLSSNVILDIYKDNSNTVWVGTFEGGVNVYNKIQSKFKLYQKIPGVKNGLSYNSVLCLYECSDGTIWIGTDGGGGLDIFNPSTEEFKNFKHSPTNTNTLSGNVITSICEDHHGNVWVGTYATGLNKYNPTTKEFTRFIDNPSDPRSLGDKNVWSLLEDQKNNLWVGLLGGGLARFNPNTQDFDHYRNDINDTLSLSDDLVVVLFEDSRGNLWVGTENGLNLFDTEKGTFKRFMHHTENDNSIINNSIKALYEDESGRLWIGTSGGMSIMNIKNFQVVTSPISEFLSYQVVNGILEDENNLLWVSTNTGLYSHNPTSNETQRFSTSDGLQGNEFNYGSSVKSEKTGMMFFGGINGLNSFMPKDIVFSSFNPNIVITDLKVLGKSVSKSNLINDKVLINESLPYLNEITLTHEETVFSVEFSSLDYASSNQNKYRYKLEGHDELWNYTDASRRIATYMNLPPDDYKLYIQGTNSDGVWSTNERVLNITILPPWWATWWFRIVLAIAIISLFFLLHYSRVRLLKKQKYKLNEMVEERTEIIQNQIQELVIKNKELEESTKELNDVNRELDEFAYVISHDLKAPLRGIANLSEWISNDYKDKLDEKGLEFLSMMVSKVKKLETLINDILEYSRTGKSERIFVKVNLNNIISNVLDALQVPDHFTIEVDDLPEVNGVKTEWYQILQNLITNGIKYNKKEKGLIKIYCEKIEGHQTISVWDNGIGIKEKYFDKIFKVFQTLNVDFDINSTGIGLATVRKLVELNNAKILVESEVDEYTCFSIELPKT